MFRAKDVNGDHADDATWVLTSSFVILTMHLDPSQTIWLFFLPRDTPNLEPGGLRDT